MNIKSLLLGSAAALAVVSGAQAADAIVAAEPEPMEYVRVCDAFGTGYFYIPGTETCLKVGGRVRFDVALGGNGAYAPNGGIRGTYTRSRAELFLDTASDTELGALKTNIVARWNFTDAGQNTQLIAANISLGGVTVGLADSQYNSYIGYAGNVFSDDVVYDGQYELNQITYNYDAGNGFTAVASLEDDFNKGRHDYSPNVVAGVGYTAGAWGVKVVGGYDSFADEGAIKARIDATFGSVSAFLMAGWNTDGDTTNVYANSGTGFDNGWGDWAVWGGFSAPITEKAAFNFQAAYTDSKTLALAAQVAFTVVPGLVITPEVNYTKWDNALVDDDQWSGILRFERKF